MIVTADMMSQNTRFFTG